MKAFSHYSYHVSRGEYLVSDLQGARYNSSYVLTDPVVHSKNREFGLTDLGQEGIINFFHHHTCGQFCMDQWLVPRSTKKFYPLPKTTFVLPQDRTAGVDLGFEFAPVPNLNMLFSFGRK